MENFKKLNREEMKKVLGGVNAPACTDNICGGECTVKSGQCMGLGGTCAFMAGVCTCTSTLCS